MEVRTASEFNKISLLTIDTYSYTFLLHMGDNRDNEDMVDLAICSAINALTPSFVHSTSHFPLLPPF